jgi:hypothetical protein
MQRFLCMAPVLGLLLPILTLAGGQQGAAPGARRFVDLAGGKLAYEADARGNRIPDFSHCGYQGGGGAIPEVPVRVVVGPAQGDNGARIQAAIDHVSQLPADAQGFRGAVLLLAGRHEIAGRLRIATSGVVLRGQGSGANGTLLIARGVDRRALIQVAGKNDRRLLGKSPCPVADRYVPVGARSFRVKNVEGLRAGATVLVEHPSTAAWIAALGMDNAASRDAAGWLRWLPGKMALSWDRTITRINGDVVTLDAPLTSALDAALAQSTVQAYTWPGRLRQVGVENLRCVSEFNAANPHDEEHAWMAVTLEAVQDAWVRQLTAVHFVSSAVSVGDGCKCVTVDDCQSLQPVSEVGGFRRHTFHTSGQLTLFQRCKAEQGRHDFCVGHLAAGPNAFVECTATAAHSFSGPIGSWASGVLYDNVTIDGGGLLLTNREIWDQGVGWAAANCVLWQCTAPVIACRKPPTANNWAIGCWGQCIGDGGWRSLNQFVKPGSLYQAQLAERRGAQAVEALTHRQIAAGPGAAPSITEIKDQKSEVRGQKSEVKRALAVKGGWVVCDGKLLTGSRGGTAWWRGSMLPSRAGETGVGLTRFVPGRSGPGATDDLDELASSLVARRQAILEHHWGLWYDRRRDDHQMVRRLDGDVWPPFYEQPWARSGQGRAWDGLSKYDLTKFNPWYFGRLKQFADQCDRKGLLLVHQAYFQHNLLEAGAHWADFPWRPANCLQDTGFPEPPPYLNKKRIAVAETFYDVTHPVRRQLHRAYLRHCLDMLGDNTNVLFLTGEEYTGPLAFAQFWLDTVAQWQRDTGKKVLLGLSCTRDVQDAILADPVRGPLIAVIDLRYWWYAADGSLYAPRGGQSLAPRQQFRAWEGNKSRSAAQIARQVREYRSRFPDKAVLCSLDRADGWAVLAAGGSVPNLLGLRDERLLAALPAMRPFEAAGLTARQWALAEPGRHYLVYAAANEKVRIDLTGAPGAFVASWFNGRTGTFLPTERPVDGGQMLEFPPRGPGPQVLWLARQEQTGK